MVKKCAWSPFVEVAFCTIRNRLSPFVEVAFCSIRNRLSGIAAGSTSPDFPVNSIEAVGGSGEEVQACEQGLTDTKAKQSSK